MYVFRVEKELIHRGYKVKVLTQIKWNCSKGHIVRVIIKKYVSGKIKSRKRVRHRAYGVATCKSVWRAA